MCLEETVYDASVHVNVYIEVHRTFLIVSASRLYIGECTSLLHVYSKGPYARRFLRLDQMNT